DHFDNRHPCYAGDLGIGADPELATAVAESDLLLAVGTRLDEITTGGYRLVTPPVPRQRLIHVHPGAEEVGRTYRPELAVVADPASFLGELAARPAPAARPWASRTRALHARYLHWSGTPDPGPGTLRLETVVQHLDSLLPEDAIVTNGAGNYAGWVHRFFRFKRYGTQLAPRSGSMGYALPAAVAAKVLHPAREVVCFTGDGCFQMTMQEFGTACQQDAAILVLVVDNGIYATIRMHQERRYPGRVSGTTMRNPDFAALARAYGAYGARITHDGEVADALAEARRSGGPALLHLAVAPEALTTRLALDDLRAPAG
ncbi:MAG TPA: thiamine pyrophosphate-binding protein, partial [Rhodospirillales bacterium]|nr:thiamine pyrophosphate-binding protein [Rhodospirillales bacterium]